MEKQTNLSIDESGIQWDVKMSRSKKSKIKCNLCGKNFKPQNKFERFCQSCKDESEDYLLYDDSSEFY
jgi:protein-arginine kinase activator protein McsA